MPAVDLEILIGHRNPSSSVTQFLTQFLIEGVRCASLRGTIRGRAGTRQLARGAFECCEHPPMEGPRHPMLPTRRYLPLLSSIQHICTTSTL
jgi:hypothetical protein